MPKLPLNIHFMFWLRQNLEISEAGTPEEVGVHYERQNQCGLSHKQLKATLSDAKEHWLDLQRVINSFQLQNFTFLLSHGLQTNYPHFFELQLFSMGHLSSHTIQHPERLILSHPSELTGCQALFLSLINLFIQ